MSYTVIVRILFFGIRYALILWISKKYNVNTSVFLLTVSVIELFRIIFDFGLENSILARRHQLGRESYIFKNGIAHFRIAAVIIGQLLSAITVLIIAKKNDVDLIFTFIASLQFSCLMIFGYVQAIVQTKKDNLIAIFIFPITLSGFFVLISLWFFFDKIYFFKLFSLLGFEFLALIFLLINLRFKKFDLLDLFFVKCEVTKRSILSAILILNKLKPLAKSNLASVFNSKMDALILPTLTLNAVLSQYLIYQRLSAAPLMFFSTMAGASIAKLSKNKKSTNQEKYQYIAPIIISAIICGISLIVITPLAKKIFNINEISVNTLLLQSSVLVAQIINGFLAAWNMAKINNIFLWDVSRRNLYLNLVVTPLLTFMGGVNGFAASILIIELFCMGQYIIYEKYKKIDEEK